MSVTCGDFQTKLTPRGSSLGILRKHIPGIYFHGDKASFTRRRTDELTDTRISSRSGAVLGKLAAATSRRLFAGSHG